MNISVKFIDFWKGFNTRDNVFLKALAQKHTVSVIDSASDEVPDLLFCSEFGQEHLNPKYDACIKIYFTGENNVPNFDFYDYAMSFHNIEFSGRHLRYPLYLTYDEWAGIGKQPNISDEQALNRGFCSVVISNISTSDPTREEIWQRLSQYKKVSSGGRYNNNVGGPVADKTQFIKRFKFNLALENSRIDFYTTEKIVEPLAAFTVPIYWGNRLVGRDFNPEAFINISDFNSIDSAVEHIKRIDNDDEAYLKMLRSSRLAAENAVNWDERLSEFLCGIADSRQKHVSQYGYTFSIRERQRIKEALHGCSMLRGIARRLLR